MSHIQLPVKGEKKERRMRKAVWTVFLFKIKTLSFEHIVRILSSLWFTKVLVKCTQSLVTILKTPRPTGTEGGLQHFAGLPLFSRFLGSFVSDSEKTLS